MVQYWNNLSAQQKTTRCILMQNRKPTIVLEVLPEPHLTIMLNGLQGFSVNSTRLDYGAVVTGN